MSGCGSDYSKVNKSDLLSVFIINSSPTFLGYYYQGSDNDFHYFTSRWKYETDRKVKVAKADLETAKEFDLGSEPLRLTVFDLQDGGPIFCKIDGRPIYERQVASNNN